MTARTKPLWALDLTRQAQAIDPSLTVAVTDDRTPSGVFTGCSGWFGDGHGHWVYVALDHTDGPESFAVYRTAKDSQDFVGGESHYCDAADLASLAVGLLKTAT